MYISKGTFSDVAVLFCNCFIHCDILDCGETFLLQTGGIIKFDVPLLDYPQWFDCIWTVKRYITNYPDGVILRVQEIKMGDGEN